MDDVDYFRNITNTLKNSLHPEVYHYRNGNHPGPDWYLKTVCPMPNLNQIDKFGYGLLWTSIIEDHPTIIKLIPHAYDWNGLEIPYMASIWINIKNDFILTFDQKTGYTIMLVDREVGEEFYINSLNDLILMSREESKNLKNVNKYLDELDEIEEIADLLGKEVKSKTTIQQNDLKLLDGGLNEDK